MHYENIREHALQKQISKDESTFDHPTPTHKQALADVIKENYKKNYEEKSGIERRIQEYRDGVKELRKTVELLRVENIEQAIMINQYKIQLDGQVQSNSYLTKQLSDQKETHSEK